MQIQLPDNYDKEEKWPLYYYQPKIEIEYGKPVVTYQGVDQKTKQWVTRPLNMMSLVENIVQALARQLMVYAWKELERAFFTPVLNVYDEIVCYESIDSYHATLEHMIKTMCKKPWWAKDIPLRAEGFTTKRYRKG
jgi:DNA polymerase